MAIARMDRSLREFRIRGVKTNIPFLENVIQNETFRAGKATTRLIDTTPSLFEFKPRLDRASKLLSYLGDVIVAYPRVVAQAAEHGHSILQELRLLVVHGDGRLEDAGEVRLPALQKQNSHPGPRPSAPRRASARTDPPPPFARSLSELDPVQLRWVSDRQEEGLWNEYIERYHYLGHTPLPGAQLRYLIESDQGLLGALGFGAAAWKVASRDRWIGWDRS